MRRPGIKTPGRVGTRKSITVLPARFLLGILHAPIIAIFPLFIFTDMVSRLSLLRPILRRTSLLVLPPLLVLISLGLLASQFTELATNNEILSLTSFVVLISFSALAFNWCRVSPTLASEDILRGIYQAGIDLFLASLLALVAAFFAWLQTLPKLYFPKINPVLFSLHWIFFLLSILLFLTAVLSLVQAVQSASETKAK